MTVSNLSTGLRPGVCLSSSRPTVPFEGQMIYETDTDLTYIYGGSAWQQVSGGTAVGNSGLVYVTSQTLSSTATNIVGCFSATYDTYLILGQSMGASSAPDLIGYRMLSGTTPLITSSYYTAMNGISSAGVANTIAFTSNVGFTGRTMAAGTDQSAFSFTMDNPFKTRKTFAFGTSTSNGATYYGWAGSTNVDNTVSYDGIQILSNSGYTITGTVTIYGYRK